MFICHKCGATRHLSKNCHAPQELQKADEAGYASNYPPLGNNNKDNEITYEKNSHQKETNEYKQQNSTDTATNERKQKTKAPNIENEKDNDSDDGSLIDEGLLEEIEKKE